MTWVSGRLPLFDFTREDVAADGLVMSDGKQGGGGGSAGDSGGNGGSEKTKAAALVLPGPTLPELTREGALKSSTRAKFHREYLRYCEEVDAYAGTAGGTVHKASLKSCINADALRCALLARSLRKEDKTACVELSEVTDDVLTSWLCPKEKTAMLVSANEIIDVVKRVVWRWSDACWSDAVASMTERFMSALSDNNLESCLKETRLQKELVSLFVSKISPTPLHDPLEADVSRDKELKYDLSKVIDAARELAERLDEDRIPHVKPTSRERNAGGGSSEPAGGSSSQAGKGKKRKDSRTDEEILREGRFQPFKPDTHRSRNQRKLHQGQPSFIPPCVHKECKKTSAKHYASDCPNYSSTDDADKDLIEAGRQRWEKKKVRFLKKARLRRLLALASEARRDALKTSLAGKKAKSTTRFLIEGEWISVDDATDDSGAELSVIGRRIVTRLKSRGVDLNLSPLETPVKLVSACGSHVACDSVLEVKHMSLCLDDGSKTVFRNVKFLVSCDVDELLLGRSFLDTIGFTLADFLKENSGRLHGLDVSHDTAIDDYVTSGAAGDGSFGRVARLASMGGCERYESVPVSSVSDVCVDFNAAGGNGSAQSEVACLSASAATAATAAVPSVPNPIANQERTPSTQVARTSKSKRRRVGRLERLRRLQSTDPTLLPSTDVVASVTSPQDSTRFNVVQGRRYIFPKLLDEDPLDIEEETPLLEIGIDTADELATARRTLVDKAINNGLPVELIAELAEMVEEFADIFRIKLTENYAKCEPLEIHMCKDSKPVVAAPRRYTPKVSEYLRKYEQALTDNGLVERADGSSCLWISPVHVVAKPPPALYRPTIDLRGPNSYTAKVHTPLPDQETELAGLVLAKCFAKLDFAQAYWQIRVHPKFAHFHAFRGVNGIYIPKYMLQGGKNAGQHFHHVVYPKFQRIWDKLLAWLDDYLAHARTPRELLNVLRTFFTVCREHNFKLQALKCELFALEVVWCGRKITPQGITFEPRGVDGLLDMPRPNNAAELTQFTHAANWMRGAIPDFSRLIAPLNNLLQDCSSLCGSTKKES